MQVVGIPTQRNLMLAGVLLMAEKKNAQSPKAVKQAQAKRFGEYIREMLRERGLVYRAAAEKSGGVISHSAINKIVNGKQMDLRGDTLIGLAKALDLTTEHLIHIREGRAENGEEKLDSEIAALLYEINSIPRDERGPLEPLIRAIRNEVKRIKKQG